MIWQFRGAPHYLKDQVARFKANPILGSVKKDDRELYKVQTVLSQLNDRSRRVRHENGKPCFPKHELDGIKEALREIETHRTRLYLHAGAVDAMLAEAYDALGVEPPSRSYEIFCDNDPSLSPILPLGDGTVGVSDDADSGATEGE